jgi:protein-S-isoprenylcysteine O-methyltransferase Ste14
VGMMMMMMIIIIIIIMTLRKILKEETESKSQLCKEYEETIDHQTSGCLILERMNTS